MLLGLSIISLLGSFALCWDPTEETRIAGRNADILDSYDFIIIGGGTSGLTVADRLTENPNGALPKSYPE
jgi:DeoR/GlpR family transcriptional regulator of sugar metabolism